MTAPDLAALSEAARCPSCGAPCIKTTTPGHPTTYIDDYGSEVSGMTPTTSKYQYVHIDEGMREREQAFLKVVWEALKGDHNDLWREAIILRAYRAAIAAMMGGAK